MDIIGIEITIRSRLLQVTNIAPEILFRKNSKDILVIFQGNIPDEETTIKIENVLRNIGKPIPNHSRDNSFISFLIKR